MMVAGSISAIADIANSGNLIVPEGTTPDPTITITGLAKDDTVTLYKIISYVSKNSGNSVGWELVAPFASDADCVAVFERINKVTNGVYSLTQADVAKFTKVINDNKAQLTAVTGGAVANGTFTYTLTDVNQSGMYIALVAASEVATLYNPIIVSADFNNNNGTDTIDASSASVGGGTPDAMLKKTTVDLNKEQDDVKRANAMRDAFENLGYKVGDTVKFTVTTTIPVYQDIYANAKFNVIDTMSAGLEYKPTTLVVKAGDTTLTPNTEYTVAATPRTGATWEINFKSDYILDLAAAQPITITYEAEIKDLTAYYNVNEEKNEVTVEFSNNPNNDQEVGKLKDETREYTFSIDGTLLGQSSVLTSEIVKVAVDGNGDPIFQSSATGATYTNALAGAKFALYTDPNCSTLYTNNKISYDYGNIVTDADGHIYIPGLEDGKYWFKELTAPAGYIKDMSIHHIEINAYKKTVTVAATTEYPEYSYEDLDYYTVKIDGANTTTYRNTLTGPVEISEMEASNGLVNNTKGVELPSTGGIGTTIFYVGGSLMVLAAAILLITKRRMGAED